MPPLKGGLGSFRAQIPFGHKRPRCLRLAACCRVGCGITPKADFSAPDISQGLSCHPLCTALRLGHSRAVRVQCDKDNSPGTGALPASRSQIGVPAPPVARGDGISRKPRIAVNELLLGYLPLVVFVAVALGLAI